MDKIQIMKFSEVPLLYEFKFIKSSYYGKDEYIMNHRYKKSDDLISLIEIDDPRTRIIPRKECENDLCEVYVFDYILKEYKMCKRKINDLESELKTFITSRDGLKKRLKEYFDYNVE